ncbi:MAG: hypothetical protein NXH80_10045 [Rhodobacteraceae bacterium]|nr:hypothetical protein [Paracoccaceae bacterium]
MNDRWAPRPCSGDWRVRWREFGDDPTGQAAGRDVYLNDIKLIGCTGWDEPVFPNMILHIERREIRPLLAKTLPPKDIALAQAVFLKKQHFGNFELIAPAPKADRFLGASAT